MNTFGPPGYDLPLIQPQCVAESRLQHGRDLFPELALANSYYSLSGHYPDVGWLLLDRRSYDRIDPYRTDLELTMWDCVNPPLTIKNLAIVQAGCVTRGIESDPDAIYLIQVTNGQGVIYNPWSQLPINRQYNVRAPAYPGKYYDGTTNGGSAWTWDGMLGDMWSLAPDQLGAYPGLPTAVNGVPENYSFVGVPMWDAIGEVLDHLGLSVAGEYPSFAIVVRGADDTDFTTMQEAYRGALKDDMEYLDGGSGRVPSEVVVYFHRHNRVYGTEETVRYDSLQWQTTPAYSVTVPGPARFANSRAKGHVWAEFTVGYDQDGSPLAADVVTATTLAQERAGQYYRDIFRGTQGFMRQTYAGALPFGTGSLVDGVRWYNTGEPRPGWHTEIVRGHVWPEATFPAVLEGFSAK